MADPSRARAHGRTGPDGPAWRGRGWALLATSLGFAVVQLDVSVVNVAIRPIGAELGGQVTDLQWVVNAYTVAFAALILSAGAFGDRLGAKRVFLTGFAVFTTASIACGLAPNLAVLDVARAVQGIGAAVLVPCSLSLLNHAYPDPQARGRAVALWAAGASVALSGGPLVGGLLTATWGWRAVFFINVPIGLAGIALARWRVAETPRSTTRGIDLGGQALAVLTLAALAWATIAAGQRGFTLAVVSGFLLAAVAGAGFVRVESRRAEPMLPLRLFRSPTFSATTSIGLLINIAFYGLIFVFSLYFQTARGYSPLLTGLAFAPMTGAVLAANVLAPRLARRLGARVVIAVGAVAVAAGAAALVAVNAARGYPELVGQLILVGFGIGLVVPPMTSEMLGSVAASRSGVASGTLNTARQTGSVIGVALFGALAATDLVAGLRRDLIIAVALGVIAAACTIAVGRPGNSRADVADDEHRPAAGGTR